jgi:hypothetical protein
MYNSGMRKRVRIQLWMQALLWCIQLTNLLFLQSVLS